MNDNVVDGEVLKDFMQNEYDFRVGVFNMMNVDVKDNEMRQVTKDYFIKMSKQFKVVIDLHD